MKILFIGGTGLISSACSELATQRGHEVYILNRGQSQKYSLPAGAQWISADIYNQAEMEEKLRPHHFDAVVDWIAFTPTDIERDLALFRDKTRQYVFISSASVYQKPPTQYLISESTPLANPYWDYAQQKISCEDWLMAAYREDGFPITIIRPSLTYGPSQIPLCVGSWQHPYTLIDRMKRGKPVIVPGDGTSLWTVTWNGDFAKGLVGLLGRETTLGHAFHITSDEVLTWNQIFREAGHAAGVEPKLVHIPSEFIGAHNPDELGSLLGDKAHSAVFDNSKIKRYVPDFVATVPWSEGVRRSLAWFEADPARQTIDEDANAMIDKTIAAYLSAFPD